MSQRPAMRDDRTELRVARLAAQQEGLVHERQLRAIGLDKRAVWRWREAGRLHRRYPHVYAVGHPAVSHRGRLIGALLYAGPGAALSHSSGASWWSLIDTRPDEIHVSAPVRRRAVDGVRIHHPQRVERVVHHGLPVTPVARTLLDFASEASVRQVRRAIARADYLGLLDAGALRDVLGQGRPGSAALRAVAADYLPQFTQTLSPLEDEFLLLCRRENIPLPLVNHRIGPYLVDAYWPAARLIVELDGRAAHGSDAQRHRDHERDMHLRSLGYTVLRYSWHQVLHAPKGVASELTAILSAA